MPGNFFAVLLAVVISFASNAGADETSQPELVPPNQPLSHVDEAWMLHLPGISGHRSIDDHLIMGFRAAGFEGRSELYDWTGDNAGLGSLLARKRNLLEAQKVADLITDRVRKNPSMHVLVSGHSGGTAIAVWALEKLPDDVQVDQLLLMASALSPDYDLSKALSHVRRRCISFFSDNDVIVLKAGTLMMGTMDGKKSESAGEFGFIMPVGARADEYGKLIQKPYDKTWIQYHNRGDHIGCMLYPFVKSVVAPMVLSRSGTHAFHS